MNRLSLPLILATAGLGGACSSAGTPDAGPSGRLAVGIAPLTLAGVSDACYDLRVKQGALPGTGLVWEQLGLCSSRFGNNQGSLSYIGTCDASAPTGQVAKNTVELVLRSLWTGGTSETGTELDDYRNPCPATAPCRLDADCRENADTLVEFNITIARQANQGFFDIAVNFEDIFCSAKVDCNDATGATIELLHNPDNGGQRDATLVAAFACYSGTAQTFLHMTEVTLDCPSASYTLSPSAGTGGLIPLGAADAVLFAAAVYEGFEPQAGQGLAFWNLALGIDETALPATGCSFRVRASASDSTWADGYIPAQFTTYPVIVADVPLAIVNGNLVCGIHPLDGLGSAVVTSYQPTGSLVGQPFCHELQPTNTTELTIALPGCGEPLPNQFVAAFGGSPVVVDQDATYRAVVPANAFVDAQGNPATGIIRMEASNTGLPGTALIAGAPEETHLLANFDFYDGNGNLLQVASGQSVTIYIPIPELFHLVFEIGDTVPVYYYDPTTSSWELETTGTVVALDGHRYLMATVSHFTTYGTAVSDNTCQTWIRLDTSGGLTPASSTNFTLFLREFGATSGIHKSGAFDSARSIISLTRAGTRYLFSTTNSMNYAVNCTLSGSASGTPYDFTCEATMPHDHVDIDCFVSEQSCGNGQLDSGEACDGGAGCLADCTCPAGQSGNGAGGCAPLCGNGVLDPGEECDPVLDGQCGYPLPSAPSEPCRCQFGWYSNAGVCTATAHLSMYFTYPDLSQVYPMSATLTLDGSLLGQAFSEDQQLGSSWQAYIMLGFGLMEANKQYRVSIDPPLPTGTNCTLIPASPGGATVSVDGDDFLFTYNGSTNPAFLSYELWFDCRLPAP